MFALATLAQQNIDTLDDAIKIFELKGVPAAKMQKGFEGIYLLTNRKTGKTIVLSLWESKDDAVNTEQSGYYRTQMEEFNKKCTTPPVLEWFEVSVHEE